jgi:prepilin-type N-terminal cleavage/methylation domain-containing protein
MTRKPVSTTRIHSARRGFSLMEMLAVAAILGIVAGIIVPRLTGGSAASKKAACDAYQGDIEIQAELWRHHTGAWPAANLSDIGANLSYFPTGLPVCPADGTVYTIDSTGRVVGHNH